jgi:hypothetical protein
VHNWAQYGLDNAFSMNTSSNADSFVGAYLGLILLSLIATMVVVALVLSGAIVGALIAGIVAGIAFNYATMYLNSQQNGTPMPPFWCALPCGPVLVDAYQYWFTDTFNTFVNPCY